MSWERDKRTVKLLLYYLSANIGSALLGKLCYGFLSENLRSLTFSLTSFLLLESNRSRQTTLPVFI